MKNMVFSINDSLRSDAAAFVLQEQKNYYDGITAVAERIAADDDIKIVAIAGPSGAGKTTTAHILEGLLEKLGENVEVVSLDDFYMSFDRIPRLPDGRADIESVAALDAEEMKRCFDEIIKHGRCVMPTYDFVNKKSIPDSKVIDIGERGIVVVEGLHALNPVISNLVDRKNIFKLYISVNSSVFDENGETLLTSRQIRLMRRSLRDEVNRGADINHTLSLWSGVIEGEEKYLYCFKPTADAQLVTLHAFEPGLYKEKFLSMKKELREDTPLSDYFLKTAKALEGFDAVPAELIPENSLIREFIGDMGLK